MKEEYADNHKMSHPLLRVGGVVVADNVLWGGQVAGKIRAKNQVASTEALREFNRQFVNHPQLRAEILSFGDGIAYGVKVR
jgi:predicted O-methyltransferase YrrM